jgi:hypothetical protein
LGFLVEKLTLRLLHINAAASSACLPVGRVNPERGFFTSPPRAGICAAEWVKTDKGIEGLRARGI